MTNNYSFIYDFVISGENFSEIKLMEQHQVLCRNGCGFYSNQGKDGLCSVCYKEMIKKKQQPPVNMPASLTPTSTASKPATSSHQASGSVETATPTVVLPKTQPVKVGRFLRYGFQ